MDTRRLGSSDIEVSAIGLGSWLTYSGGVGREQAEACTNAAFDAGITFYDTANAYGDGAAEEAWGEILAGRDRSSYVLATKLFIPTSHGKGLSAEQVATQIDLSLGRLRTDYVDLYQCHRFDVEVPVQETVGALAELVRAGKVRALGFSEWTPEQIEAGIAAARAEGVALVSSQPQYSMLWRAPEVEVLELCARNGISQVVWSPLAEGLLTGKYEPGQAPPSDSRASSDEMSTFIARRMDDDVLERIQRLKPIAADLDLSMAQLALAWVLRRTEVASAIIGASRPEQVHDNAAAAGVELDQQSLDAIDDVLGDAPVTSPELAPLATAGLGASAA